MKECGYMLFTNEVKDMDELVEQISSLTELKQIKVAVVCFLFDNTGKLILHRRGPGARDEIGKLQAIGGSVNNTDDNFREAMMRELREEAGTKAIITLDKFIGAQLDGKIDNTTNKYVDWIILAYKGTVTSGELINSEPERCIGFEKNTMENFLNEELSKTAYNFIKYMLDNNI